MNYTLIAILILGAGWIVVSLRLLKQMEKVMSALDDLKANVAQNTSVEQSAVAPLTNIKAQLDAAIAANDPAALQALSDTLGANNTALSQAITANTPAA